MSIAPVEHELEQPSLEHGLEHGLDMPWLTLVWNDPVNLMSYVTYVFQTYFGYNRELSEKLMLQVHHEGRAVVSRGPRELMEQHTEALQAYGLWATFQKDD